MSMGMYAFAERFATAMTSEECRAAADKDQFRREYWEKCLSWVTDDKLREILSGAGPFMVGTDFRMLVNRLFDHFGDSGDMSPLLIALSMLREGVNPRFIADHISPWWDTDHFVWLMNRSKKQNKRTPKEEYVKPDSAA